MAGREHEALAAIYDALGSLVFGISLRVIGDEAQAEAVTQETFVQVWQHAHRFDPDKGSARSWVAVLAHRRAVDVVRRAQRASDRDGAVAWTGSGELDGVAHAADADVETTNERLLMSGLTDLQRESIGLAYYVGLTHLEVSQWIGAQDDAVRTRIRDGLIYMRDSQSAETTGQRE